MSDHFYDSSEKCKTKAEDILVLPLDVAKCDTHKDAVQAAIDKFGHVSCGVHINIGTLSKSSVGPDR